MHSRLDPETGLLSVGFAYTPKAAIRLEGFIWAEGNVMCVRVEVEGDLGWGGWPRLILRKWPDAIDASIPDSVLDSPLPDIVALTQQIPGDEEIDPFA